MNILHNKNITPYTTLGCNITATSYISCTSQEDLQNVIHEKILDQGPRCVLGGGANILFRRSVFEGCIVHMQIRGIKILEENDMQVTLEVGAGENWPDFVQRCVDQGYGGGIENLANIPGSVGASPVGNIGAYGKEVAEFVEKVGCVDSQSGDFFELTKEQCRFAYRWSIFKGDLAGEAIVTKVIFRLQKRHKEDPLSLDYKDIQAYLIQHTIAEETITPSVLAHIIASIRSEKLPDLEHTGSAGSFFKNPILSLSKVEYLRNLLQETYHTSLVEYPTPYRDKIKISAGQLLELGGRKGKSEGFAGMYEKHALILVNNEKKAHGEELWAFAEKVIRDIEDKFEVSLEPEVVLV